MQRMRSELEGMGLQIGLAEQGEFIIGDDPVQTVDSRSGLVGILSGVPVAGADTFVFPLGPRHLVAANKTNETLPVAAEGVRRLNRIQVITAQKKVYFRPGTELGATIAHELDTRATL